MDERGNLMMLDVLVCLHMRRVKGSSNSSKDYTGIACKMIITSQTSLEVTDFVVC